MFEINLIPLLFVCFSFYLSLNLIVYINIAEKLLIIQEGWLYYLMLTQNS